MKKILIYGVHQIEINKIVYNVKCSYLVNSVERLCISFEISLFLTIGFLPSFEFEIDFRYIGQKIYALDFAYDIILCHIFIFYFININDSLWHNLIIQNYS